VLLREGGKAWRKSESYGRAAVNPNVEPTGRRRMKGEVESARFFFVYK
jgi:hypothetical protein